MWAGVRVVVAVCAGFHPPFSGFSWGRVVPALVYDRDCEHRTSDDCMYVASSLEANANEVQVHRFRIVNIGTVAISQTLEVP